MLPWAQPSLQPKQHLDQFSGFCMAHDGDRQTDHATLSVTIGRIYLRSTAMWPNNNVRKHCRRSERCDLTVQASCDLTVQAGEMVLYWSLITDRTNSYWHQTQHMRLFYKLSTWSEMKMNVSVIQYVTSPMELQRMTSDCTAVQQAQLTIRDSITCTSSF